MVKSLRSMSFTFRPMSARDIEFVNRVRNASADFLHDSRRFTIAETIEWFSRGKSQDFWIVEFDEQRLGYFRAVRVGGDVLQIGADLAPEFRGQGLSYKLFKEFALRMPYSGIKTLTLRVLRTNTRALHIYSKLGFLVTQETQSDFKMETCLEKVAEFRLDTRTSDET